MQFTYIDIRQSDLSANARLVGVMLLSRTPPDSNQCWPGLNRLAADTGLSRSSVKRAVVELKTGGWIRVTKRRTTTNVYTLTKPCEQVVHKVVDETVQNESRGLTVNPRGGSQGTPKTKEKTKEVLLQERKVVDNDASRRSTATAGSPIIRKLAKAWEVDRD